MSYWQDKVALVTGGSAGLGLAISRRLVERGAKVSLVARGEEALKSTARSIGGDVLPIVADVTNPNEVEQCVDETLRRFGKLHLVCHSAGKSMRGEVLATSREDFEALWRVNFLAATDLVRAAAEQLIALRGHVVLIGSLASRVAPPYLGAYPTSKFPLDAYAQQLRLELGPRGLHTLLVCPGPIAREDRSPRYVDANVPDSAHRPGGGARVRAIDPDLLAAKILTACESRQPELVVPSRSKVLFAMRQLSPRLGDWLLRKMTGNKQ
jgi:NAD(P)-dependent dehydrogenase (short-subunit alcohol dehydrogenase family)